MAAINNENVVIDIDSQSCITFLKVSNDLLNSFCDSGECNFKPTRGCTKTLSPVTNIHQTIIQMESKVIYHYQISSFLFDLNHPCIVRRSSDPGTRRQSDTNEASGLTNNQYWLSGDEGKAEK